MPILFGSMEAFVLAVLVAGAASLLTSAGAQAALQRPTYTAGDRWTYVLTASLDALPGMNGSQGVFGIGLNGLAEVEVLGPALAAVGGAQVPGVRVATRASASLEGSFGGFGNASVQASGSFSSESTEVWESESELPTLSNSSSSYVFSVTVGLTFSVRVQTWINASTSYASLPAFNLSVGETAEAPFTTDLTVVTAASVIGPTLYNETSGTAVDTWSRHVLDLENVTVDAGTFSSYRLNESLGAFPGLGIMVSGGGTNATSWFSNDVGYYVERQAFVNGTPVAEMRLKSYTYPAAPPGLSAAQIALIVGLPLAAVLVIVLFLLRRRKGKGAIVTDGTAGPVGELPPKHPGGGP